MASISDYYENKIIDHMLRGQSFTPPSTIYLALYTEPPSDSGGGTEVSGGGYQRQPISLAPASNGATYNVEDIVFPTATSDWGTIVAVGIFDAQTGGNLLMWAMLTTPKTVNAGDTFIIKAGDLDISFD
jgi:hypothetical protein